MSKDPDESLGTMRRLLDIMARLRDPDEGCPWDREQDFESIAPYTIEEAYEVDDAIRRGDMDDLQDELGDLLLQVVYHAQMASEAGAFDFEDVVRGISDKLIRRHPHVFGEARAASREEVRRSWEETKALERSERASRRALPDDPFAGIPSALPALMRAAKLQSRAPAESTERDAQQALLGAVEGLSLSEAGEAREGLGDVLFAAVAVARRLRVDPERALRDASDRFVRELRSDPGNSKSADPEVGSKSEVGPKKSA
ncbi:MAG: nucleoside triphosphate pyrophosphohydrolase [Myxococcota bacterium]|nr:nucleoside triphosphate pyrophosphohydrolase [Myxococcota bacterium]